MQKPHLLDCLTMNIKAVQTFETHAAVYLTQHNILEDVSLQQHYCEDLELCCILHISLVLKSEPMWSFRCTSCHISLT
jgi:hypothetical protein